MTEAHEINTRVLQALGEGKNTGLKMAGSDL